MTLQVRRAVVALPVCTFAPGQSHTLVVQPDFAFRAERLVIPKAPATRWERVVGQLRWSARWPRRALREVTSWVWSSIRWRRYRDEMAPLRLPALRWPGKGPPLDLVNIRVGVVPQNAAPIPAEMFSADSPALMFDTAPRGQYISVEFRSYSDKPYDLRGAYFVGIALMPPSAPSPVRSGP